jgi:predicted transcriptional regulator
VNSESDEYTKRDEGRPRRGKFDIWASILDSLIKEDTTLNAIADSTKLNWATAKKHVEKLAERRLIKVYQSKFVTYSITKDGIAWLRHYKSMATREPNEADYSRLDFR